MNVQFLGATHQVTGSSYVLDAGGVKILIDCGLYQEREYAYRNWQDFPVPPNQILRTWKNTGSEGWVFSVCC